MIDPKAPKQRGWDPKGDRSQSARKRRHTLSAMAPRNSKTTAAIAKGPLNSGSKPVAKATRAINNRASVVNTTANLQQADQPCNLALGGLFHAGSIVGHCTSTRVRCLIVSLIRGRCDTALAKISRARLNLLPA